MRAGVTINQLTTMALVNVKLLLFFSLTFLPLFSNAQDFVLGRPVVIIPSSGSWDELQDMCLQQGYSLVTIRDEWFHHELVKLLKSKGYGGRSFWIGGKLDFLTGTWVEATPLQAEMPRGTPFWGIAFDDVHQEPYEANPSAHPSYYACLYHVTYHHIHSCYNSARIGGICG